MSALLSAVLRWCAGFAEVHAEQSMTRLCALLFALVGCVLGVAGATIAVVAVAKTGKTDGVADLVKSLGVFATLFIVNGCGALLLRTKQSEPLPPVPPVPPSPAEAAQ
jgi:hypothetical protein